MPKTTVNKNSQPLFAKSEIWFSKEGNVPAPTADFVLTEKPSQDEFGIFISTTADEGHHFGAFFLCPNVGHKPCGRNRLFSLQVKGDGLKNFRFGTTGLELCRPSPAGMKNIPR